MNDKQSQFNWPFALQWIASCAIGTAVFAAIAFNTMWSMSKAISPSNEIVRVGITGLLFGALVILGGTLGPGLLLRRKGISAGRWIGYSIVAAVITVSGGVTIISSQGYRMDESATSALFLGLAFGLPTGLVQWYLLRQQGLSATLWPLISATSYLLAFGVIVSFSLEGSAWLVLSIAGLFVGGITGLGIRWILGQERAVAL